MNRYTLGGITAITIGIVTAVLVANHTAEAPTLNELSNTTPVADMQTNAPNTEPSQFSGAGTFADFLNRGDSGVCTFTSVHEAGSSEGTFWYDGERIRIESVTRADGEIYTSNVINDSTKTYIWGGTAAGMQAMVFPNNTNTEPATDDVLYDTGQADARVSMDQQIEYNCESWTPRSTQFIPPSNIEFVDMDAMLQGMFEGELRGLPEGMDF